MRSMSINRIGPGIPVLVLFLTLVLVPAVPALAHKVYLFAWVEGDQVMVDSYFSKAKKVQGGKIIVYDSSGRKLLEGLTDDQGRFSFKPPQKADLHLVVEAGMGHQGEFLLPAGDLPETTAEAQPDTASVQSGAASFRTMVSPAEAVQIDPDQIKKVVERALDERLGPLVRSIAELREDQGPGLTEIVGGIGYIFGIMGLFMYFRRGKS